MIKNLKQTIAQEARLEDVVQKYAELHRGSKSGKTLMCSCPFHKDDEKSFKIKVTDQTYECDVCKEAGDVVRLTQQLVGCNEGEALRLLVDWFHIPIDENGLEYLARKSKRKKEKEKSMFTAKHREKEFNMLLNSFTSNSCSSPLLAYAHQYLELGVAADILPDTYEQISGCKLFPVRDDSGSLQGFLKYVPEEKEEEEGFCIPADLRKTNLLGLYQAIEAIKRCGFAYLVWNSKDLMIMHAAGFTNTVACCGPELTYRHIESLLKQTNQVVFMYPDEISKQVRATKAAARLSHLSITPCRFPLPRKGLSSLYYKMEPARFEYFIRQSTRLNYLDAVNVRLIARLEEITKQLASVQVLEEKLQLRSELIQVRNKVDKLTGLLDRNWDYLYRYFG